MARRKLDNKRLDDALRRYEPAIRRAFLEAIAAHATGINIASLVAALEAGNVARAVDIAAIPPGMLFPADAAITGTYVAGGQMVAASAPAFAATIGFDGRATRAQAWATRHVGGLVTDIVQGQRDMLQETISAQIIAGVTPRTAALDIAGRINAVSGVREGGYIGLSRPQAAALLNVRADLANLDSRYFTRELRDRRFDRLVREAIDSGRPLMQTDIDRIAGRYADRALKSRADMIARTESITALRAGRREGIAQAIEQGAIADDKLKRRWSATGDERTREDHADMDGEEVEGIDTPWQLPDGSMMLFPGDTSLGAEAGETINCRCYEEYVVDWLSA